MDFEVTILNDEFQLVALSHEVEFVFEMSTGAATRAIKQDGKLCVCVMLWSFTMHYHHNTSIARMKKVGCLARKLILVKIEKMSLGRHPVTIFCSR
jgi:hypothetical protein